MNVTAQAKDSFQLTSLTLQVYLADQNNFRQLISATIAQNTNMVTGDVTNKQVQFTVPSDAPRTSLLAQVTESVSAAYYPYGTGVYPYWNGNPYAYPYAYAYWNGATYSYVPPNYPSYLSSSAQSTSDNTIAPLSYVLASTPEYVALQSQYQQLQAQNQQLQTQNQQLGQQIQTLQGLTAQKDSTIGSLNDQLSSARGTTTLLEIIAVVLGIVTVAIAALHFRSTKTSGKVSPSPPKTEEKTEAKTASGAAGGKS
jgi:hypothetical protein